MNLLYVIAALVIALGCAWYFWGRSHYDIDIERKEK